tara:strand:+ start:21010 stop:21924 length:915 start_codon:yes stop_codon:yes gene_type:complete
MINKFLLRNQLKISSYVSFLGILMVLFQITLGGIVRITESGLGCPDWPLCDGQIVPELDFHTAIEWGHRVSGASIGILIILINIISIKFFGRKSFQSIIAFSLLLLVILEGILGGITVLTELAWWVRLIHLGGSFIILFLFAYLFSSIGQGSKKSFMSNLKKYQEYILNITMIGLLILMLYGSAIVGLGVNSSCMSWPDCMGQWIRFNETSYFLHMIHRYLALVFGLMILYLSHAVGRVAMPGSFVKVIARLLGLTFVIHILFSIGLVHAGFDGWLRVVHLSLAGIIWLLVSWLFIEYRIFKTT